MSECKLALIVTIWVTVKNKYLYRERETLKLDVAFTLHSTQAPCATRLLYSVLTLALRMLLHAPSTQ